MRKLLLLAASTSLVVGTATAALALEGDAPTTVGWWSQDPTAAEQPEGGFQVSAVGGEAVSIAALRFDVADDATNATLELQEAEGSVVSPATALQVCRTTEQWEPANPGAFADAPEPDCEAAVDLQRDETTLVWTASVGSLLADGASLVVTPADTAGGGAPVDPGFQVTFTEAALAVVAGPALPAGAAPMPSSTPPAASSPSFSGAGGSSFTPPGGVTPAAPAADATTPTTVAVEDAEGDAAVASPMFESEGDDGGGANQPWSKLLVLVPLSALIGVAFVYGKRLLQQRGVLEEA